jgi:hypothetical protein
VRDLMRFLNNLEGRQVKCDLKMSHHGKRL